jgi:hypothetical protein
MKAIQRGSVNTHEMMNLTISNNMNNSRYIINYAVKNAIANKMLKARIQAGGTTTRTTPQS